MSFRGYLNHSATDANIYFGAVSKNPVDDASLLGLFPVNTAGRHFEPPRDDASCVAVAVSCDGFAFSDLACVLASPPQPYGRTLDHPATGFVRRGDAVYMFVQHNVPGIVASRRSRVGRYAADAGALREFTRRAKAGLSGCAG